MNKSRSLAFAAGLLGTLSSAVAAQESLAARCEAELVQDLAYESCLAAVQAAISAQPALGIVIGGGNPTLGSAGNAGMRMGVMPRVSAGLRLNVVAVRLPDLLVEQMNPDFSVIAGKYGAPAPALMGDVSVGLFDGLELSPGTGGIGGVSLLGNVGYVPFSLLTDGIDSNDFAYGVGARLHLLQESFVTPGISLSLMRKKLPQISFGNICPSGIIVAGTGANTQYGACAGSGDIGEFTFDLIDWSTRLVVSKRLLGFGATAGFGYDRYSSDIAFGFRGDDLGGGAGPVFRVTDEVLKSDRWAVFGNLSYTFLVASLGLEAGWQQGTAPISGFDDVGSGFDPRSGTWFASAGLRVGL